MQLATIDLVIFFGFIAAVLFVGMIKSRGEGKDSESYFLAGRGLKWWLIGVSLIAANISSEQFVGMSGQAADYLGIAISSYEWMAAITLVVVAFCFLPYFLRTGIFTIPEFLEHRYNGTARAIMAFSTMVLLIGVSLTGVIYAGALTMSELFPVLSLAQWCWLIGGMAAVYVAAGGLNASAWADLIQGIALILGGGVIAWLALKQLGATPVAELASLSSTARPVADDAGGLAKLFALNHEKLHMVLPREDKNIPWTALVLGLWIPNFYYWGLNQYITQRILGSASLREGQKGIVFAAAMKLIVPFIIVIPGIIAFNLYSKDLAAAQVSTNQRLIDQATRQPASRVVFTMTDSWRAAHAAEVPAIEAHNQRVAAAAGDTVEKTLDTGYKFDAALSTLMRRLLPENSGLRGFVLAALLGAIVSSLAAVLNAASTIFTMDIYKKFMSRSASQAALVGVGRIAVGVFAVVGCLLAPNLDKFGSIFKYIQEFQGYASPGILAVFVFGLINRRAPGITGVVGLLLNPILYGVIATQFPGIAFLDRMAICFFLVMSVMWVIGLVRPLPEPVTFASNTSLDLTPSGGARMAGIGVVIATVVLYIIFW